MDNKDAKIDRISIDKDANINVVVNRTPDPADDVIELNKVFHNMKERRRVYAWLLVLLMLVGLCVPLMLAQMNQKPLTVSSVVTLKYQVRRDNGKKITYTDLKDLSAPDGSRLDLNEVKSSYVLSNALAYAGLPKAVSVNNLRRNIRIERILTEDSRRQQEVVSGMIDSKNSGAYAQAQGLELTYENQFIVSLTNGFGDENSQKIIYLTDSELRFLLNQILDAYNDYLIRTYADLTLPEDKIALADPEALDVLECLDLVDAALEDLKVYCENKPQNVLEYRSYVTGYTLTELLEVLNLFRQERMDELYSFARTEAIAEVPETLISGYQYKLDSVDAKIKVQEGNINTVQGILDGYQNESIYVSVQESGTTKSATTTTDYYNQLILEQAANYETLADLEIKAANYRDTIGSLRLNAENDDLVAKANEELAGCIAGARAIYGKIREQMKEIFSASFYTEYLEHSSAQGKSASVFAKAVRNMAIGAVLGAVAGVAIWFIAGLVPEFRLRREKEQQGKAVTE